MFDYTGDPNTQDIERFRESITGICLCKSIAVSIQGNLFDKPNGHLCHCSNCRKVSGTIVSSNLLIDKARVTIDDRDGTLKEFIDRETGSGQALSRFFCGTCGNPIMSVTPTQPGKVIVKMGIFPRIPHPAMENFVAHKHDWEGKFDGVVKYKTRIFADKADDE